MPYRTAVDPGHVSVAPGGSVHATLTAQSISGTAGTMAWSADPPAGVTVSPAGGTVTVPASGPSTVDITVSVAGSVASGFSRVPFALTAPDGSAAGGEGVQFGNTVALPMPYRNGSGGMEQVTTYVFATAPITLSGKPVAGVTLPASTSGGDMHVFAVGTA